MKQGHRVLELGSPGPWISNQEILPERPLNCTKLKNLWCNSMEGSPFICLRPLKVYVVKPQTLEKMSSEIPGEVCGTYWRSKCDLCLTFVIVRLYTVLWDTGLCYNELWYNGLFYNGTGLYTLISWTHIDGLMQERRNSSALALELRLFCINPSTYTLPMNLLSQLASDIIRI